MSEQAPTSKYRRWAGIGLVAAGLLGNPRVLGALFAPDGTLDGEHRIITVLFVELLCVFLGATLLVPRGRAPRAWWQHWSVSAAGAVLLAAFLTGAGWGIWAYNSAHHHTTNTTGAAPTEAQRAWADEFVQRSLDAARRHGWYDFEKAKADGFVPQWGDREHYYNRDFLFDDKILDPDRPEFLMYMDTPRGKLLTGYMYYARSLDEKGPQPGGAITAWHLHDWAPRGYCAEQGLLVVARPDPPGTCASGTFVTRSGEMLHVFFIEHPLGPYADAMVFPDGAGGLSVTHIHPIAVHFTIALVVVAVLLDLLGRATTSPTLHAVAFVNLLIAAVSGVVTIGAGMAAEVKLLITHDVHAVLDTHKLLGFWGFGGILLLTAWRLAARGQFPRFGPLYLAAGLATAGAVLGAGYVGAQLVYDHGLAVQAIDRQALERYERGVYGGESPLAPGAPAPASAAPGATHMNHGQ
jgi:uncharacterized membrane protein